MSVATTIAHEVVHAYLISLLEENKVNGTSGIYDFPTVYEAYVQQQIAKDNTIIPAAHHELIAKKYTEVLASTIQEFHTGASTPLGSASQVYSDLAWSGLFETTYFNTSYPNNSKSAKYNERVRIINRFYVEKNVELRGELTPKGQTCTK